MQYVYFVVITHADKPSEVLTTEMFTSEQAAREAFEISYHKVAPADRPSYYIGNAGLHAEACHL